MELTPAIEVTVTFHNGDKDKIRLRRDLHNYAQVRVDSAIRDQKNLKFDPDDRVNSNVTYIAIAGTFRSVEIARL
jgi:hypothetical protein